MTDHLQKKFIEEATEHIHDLENAMLLIENNRHDSELTEKIFRSLHTLKGTGAMFGFDKISEITHDLESIYDLIRQKTIEINEDIISVTLSCVDHLRNLLSDRTLSIEDNATKHLSLLTAIHQLIRKTENKEDKDDLNELAIAGENTYYVYFKPFPQLLSNGNNPLYLIDELSTLGTLWVYPHLGNIPVLSELNPESVYISWECILSTRLESVGIQDVFMFVEGECELKVEEISHNNLLLNEEFLNAINVLKITEKESVYKDIFEAAGRCIIRSGQSNATRRQKETAISSIRVASEKLDTLMNLVSEMVTTQARLSLFAENSGIPELQMISENIQKLTRQLRDNAFDIVLVPLETVITRFQRLVRDLSAELKKKVHFIAEGVETELDKNIIENITDPILHILRNCIDHGIETPKEREKNNKPEEGVIMLKAYHSGTHVVIEISDDGAGLDANKIKAKAVQMGLIGADTQLSEKEIYNLIFLPGFSTAEKVTDVSGRGVGMDVVKRKISEIRGEVEINSVAGAGTTITIKLPLTLSIIDGLLVEIGTTYFILPLHYVNKIYAIKHSQVETAFNNTLAVDGTLFPFFCLRDEFSITENPPDDEQLVILDYQGMKAGITVDRVVGEYQAVLKPLGKHYRNQEIISGASILGDGTVALVLDTNKLIQNISNQIKMEA